MGTSPNERAVIKVDYGNRSEEWWQALAQHLETRPQTVPEPLRRLSHPRGGDSVCVTLSEARAIQAWAATLPGWSGGPRHAPYPLRVERAA